MNILFESEKQKEATERVLATVRVRTINKEIDAYLNEMLGYAKSADELLTKNNFSARVLEGTGISINPYKLIFNKRVI